MKLTDQNISKLESELKTFIIQWSKKNAQKHVSRGISALIGNNFIVNNILSGLALNAASNEFIQRLKAQLSIEQYQQFLIAFHNANALITGTSRTVKTLADQFSSPYLGTELSISLGASKTIDQLIVYTPETKAQLSSINAKDQLVTIAAIELLGAIVIPVAVIKDIAKISGLADLPFDLIDCLSGAVFEGVQLLTLASDDRKNVARLSDGIHLSEQAIRSLTLQGLNSFAPDYQAEILPSGHTRQLVDLKQLEHQLIPYSKLLLDGQGAVKGVSLILWQLLVFNGRLKTLHAIDSVLMAQFKQAGAGSFLSDLGSGLNTVVYYSDLASQVFFWTGIVKASRHGVSGVVTGIQYRAAFYKHFTEGLSKLLGQMKTYWETESAPWEQQTVATRQQFYSYLHHALVGKGGQLTTIQQMLANVITNVILQQTQTRSGTAIAGIFTQVLLQISNVMAYVFSEKGVNPYEQAISFLLTKFVLEGFLLEWVKIFGASLATKLTREQILQLFQSPSFIRQLNDVIEKQLLLFCFNPQELLAMDGFKPELMATPTLPAGVSGGLTLIHDFAARLGFTASHQQVTQYKVTPPRPPLWAPFSLGRWSYTAYKNARDNFAAMPLQPSKVQLPTDLSDASKAIDLLQVGLPAKSWVVTHRYGASKAEAYAVPGLLGILSFSVAVSYGFQSWIHGTSDMELDEDGLSGFPWMALILSGITILGVLSYLILRAQRPLEEMKTQTLIDDATSFAALPELTEIEALQDAELSVGLSDKRETKSHALQKRLSSVSSDVRKLSITLEQLKAKLLPLMDISLLNRQQLMALKLLSESELLELQENFKSTTRQYEILIKNTSGYADEAFAVGLLAQDFRAILKALTALRGTKQIENVCWQFWAEQVESCTVREVLANGLKKFNNLDFKQQYPESSKALIALMGHGSDNIPAPLFFEAFNKNLSAYHRILAQLEKLQISWDVESYQRLVKLFKETDAAVAELQANAVNEPAVWQVSANALYNNWQLVKTHFDEIRQPYLSIKRQLDSFRDIMMHNSEDEIKFDYSNNKRHDEALRRAGLLFDKTVKFPHLFGMMLKDFDMRKEESEDIAKARWLETVSKQLQEGFINNLRSHMEQRMAAALAGLQQHLQQHDVMSVSNYSVESFLQRYRDIVGEFQSKPEIQAAINQVIEEKAPDFQQKVEALQRLNSALTTTITYINAIAEIHRANCIVKGSFLNLGSYPLPTLQFINILFSQLQASFDEAYLVEPFTTIATNYLIENGITAVNADQLKQHLLKLVREKFAALSASELDGLNSRVATLGSFEQFDALAQEIHQQSIGIYLQADNADSELHQALTTDLITPWLTSIDTARRLYQPKSECAQIFAPILKLMQSVTNATAFEASAWSYWSTYTLPTPEVFSGELSRIKMVSLKHPVKNHESDYYQTFAREVLGLTESLSDSPTLQMLVNAYVEQCKLTYRQQFIACLQNKFEAAIKANSKTTVSTEAAEIDATFNPAFASLLPHIEQYHARFRAVIDLQEILAPLFAKDASLENVQVAWVAYCRSSELMTSHHAQLQAIKNNETTAAIKLQKTWRAKQDRQANSLLSLEAKQKPQQTTSETERQASAALVLQKLWRGKQVRRKLQSQHTSATKFDDKQAEAAIIALQSKWRGNKVRQQLQPQLQRTKLLRDEQTKAALVIQTNWRGSKARKEILPKLETEKAQAALQASKTQDAIVALQSMWRGQKVRNEVMPKLRQEKYQQQERQTEKSVLTIQSMWRGYKVRKDVVPKLVAAKIEQTKIELLSKAMQAAIDAVGNRTVLGGFGLWFRKTSIENKRRDMRQALEHFQANPSELNLAKFIYAASEQRNACLNPIEPHSLQLFRELTDIRMTAAQAQKIVNKEILEAMKSL